MKISFNHCIRDGDLIIVYERHDTMKAVKVCENSVLQNRFGVFKHSDWIGKPFGSIIFSNRGGFIYLLAPTLELWTLVLSHRTQILYIADISFVIMYLEVVPGCLVLESGTGSGSLTTSFARAVAPTGHVYTFGFHEQRAASDPAGNSWKQACCSAARKTQTIILGFSSLALRTQLNMQDCRQWVKSGIEDRGAKPCEFSQTAPPHNSPHSVSNTTLSGSPCNPQTVSFLELLDLPYVLDNASDPRDTLASLPRKDDYSEDIPIEDKDDEIEDDTEPNNENRSS
ncbi:hypothetical protein J1N35_003413 [Gossypium stocksii]|uniref:tRNA (adenine(58)-N(1))-methyltransferase n=1 Tax=Gossypium stocksii TaxID=47602 RepID=A0A9D3WP99_9ROSI|nr:hypothetical protein J1N35_003413 [Gossypium stocksii]